MTGFMECWDGSVMSGGLAWMCTATWLGIAMAAGAVVSLVALVARSRW